MPVVVQRPGDGEDEEGGDDVEDLGVTSCRPSRTPYTRDVTIFDISTLSMLFDVCDQSCWQSCVTPVEIRVDVLAFCIPVF